MDTKNNSLIELDKKRCPNCNVYKYLEEFNKHSGEKDGLQKTCRACQNAYSKKHYYNSPCRRDRIRDRDRRANSERHRFIFNYLLEHPCVDCGETNIMVLQFDHVKDSKSFGISNAIRNNFSYDKIMSEIDKCDVRCANCHMIRTAKSRNYWTYRFINGDFGDVGN